MVTNVDPSSLPTSVCVRAKFIITPVIMTAKFNFIVALFY